MQKRDWAFVLFFLICAILVGFDVEEVLGFDLHNHADDPHPQWIHGLYALGYTMFAMIYIGIVTLLDHIEDNAATKI